MDYSILDFLGLLGAVGLFLYGMKVMSEGLQKAAGDRLRGILSAMTRNRFTGTLTGCDEGELVWVEKEKVLALPTWEGDRIFLQKMAAGEAFFTLKLRYEGDILREAVLNGTQRLKG